MLINADGTINKDIKGVMVKTMNVFLLEDQFIQWTPTGKRLELWHGKGDCESPKSDRMEIRKVTGWNRDSVIFLIDKDHNVLNV